MYFFTIFYFTFYIFGVKGAWDGMVGEGRDRGRGWDGMEGDGFLNFHLIFQKNWSEPGNPSYYIFISNSNIAGKKCWLL